MSLFKKILGGGDPAPAPQPAAPARPTLPPAMADAMRWASTEEAAGPLPCAGIDWNDAGQLEFLRTRLGGEVATARELLESHDLPGDDADLLVLCASVLALAPTRLLEVGCGLTTRAVRAALKHRHMPAELIAIDPREDLDIGEFVDAQLQQPVQEIPFSDFEMLQSGEMLLLDLTHAVVPGGEVAHVYQRILPRMNKGTIVAIRGVWLPDDLPAAAHRDGQTEQALVQMYLTGNRRVEIVFAGGWLATHHADALREVLGADRPTWLLFRQVG